MWNSGNKIPCVEETGQCRPELMSSEVDIQSEVGEIFCSLHHRLILTNGDSELGESLQNGWHWQVCQQ